MHPSGSRTRNFHVSIISLVLLKEVMQPSGSWMRDFHASVISLVLFLEERLGDAFWCRTEGPGWILGFMSALFLGTKAGKMRAVHFSARLKVWVGFGNPMDLLERFWDGHAFKHGQLPL